MLQKYGFLNTWISQIGLRFDRRLGGDTAKTPDKYQSFIWIDILAWRKWSSQIVLRFGRRLGGNTAMTPDKYQSLI